MKDGYGGADCLPVEFPLRAIRQQSMRLSDAKEILDKTATTNDSLVISKQYIYLRHNIV